MKIVVHVRTRLTLTFGSNCVQISASLVGPTADDKVVAGFGYEDR